MKGLLKFILFIAFLFALYYAREVFVRNGVTSESKPFVTDAAEAIASHWMRSELDRRASPELNRQLVEVGTGPSLDFTFYARLGERKTAFNCVLEDYNRFRDETRNYISANYTCQADFQQGPAALLFSVVREKDNAPWRIVFFDVAAPYLASVKQEKK